MNALEAELKALGYLQPHIIDEITERAAILSEQGETDPDSLAQLLTLGCKVTS